MTEVENLIPFERDLYVEMIMRHLKEVEEQRNRNNG